MKYIKMYEQFIFELGSGTAKSYETWTKNGFKSELKIGEEIEIFFTTDSNMSFSIKIKNIMKYLDVDFGLVESESKKQDRYTDNLNKGEMWRIMSTVRKEVKNIFENSDVLGIRYIPKAIDNLPGEMGKKRDILYRLFINNLADEMNVKKPEYTTTMGIVFAKLK